MIKFLKKYLIPNESNDYKPHALRGKAVSAVLALSVLLLILSLVQNIILTNTNILAAIINSVLVDMTNENRINNNLNPLTPNPLLALAAQKKADDMAAKSYFAHTSPEGITPWHWFNEAGYYFVNAGENLAVDFSDSFDVSQAWMNSPTHRANILNKNFTEIGIATAKGVYNGRETIFVVQEFGHPAFASVPSPVAVAPTPAPVSETETIPVIEPAPEVAGEEAEVAKDDTEVLGEDISVIPEPVRATVENIKTIVGDSEFIAVSNTENISLEEATTSVAGAKTVKTSYSSVFAEMITSPRNTLNRIYFVLVLFGLLALILNIFIEIKKQHPLHICYGICVILLLVIFMFINKEFILTEVLIK